MAILRLNTNVVFGTIVLLSWISVDDTGESITVRGCGLDSGTATTDTEIIRMSHCGRFYYNDRYVHGCLQSCNDADACNTSHRTSAPMTFLTSYVIAVLLSHAVTS